MAAVAQAMDSRPWLGHGPATTTQPWSRPWTRGHGLASALRGAAKPGYVEVVEKVLGLAMAMG